MMGSSDKDRSLKRQALVFCISQGLVPYCEVLVSEKTQLSSSVFSTTDLDVLALGFDWSGLVRRTLFDCKSSKESPINRALWAAGLVSHLGLSDGYVILRRAASPTHKFSADRSSIYLFDEKSFERFAKFYSPFQNGNNSYLADMARFDEISRFFSEKSPLRKLYAELVQETPLQRDSALGLRRVIAQLSEARGELDPQKRAHVYLICEAVASVSVYLFDFLSRLIRLVGADFDEKDFSDLAKYMVWGGAENLEEKKKIRQLVLPNMGDDPDFPEWDEFIRLLSTLIVAISQIPSLPLAMRNLAFRLAGDIREESESFTRDLLTQPRNFQMVISILRYLRVAAKLPKEFVSVIEGTIEDIAGKTKLR